MNCHAKGKILTNNKLNLKDVRKNGLDLLRIFIPLFFRINWTNPRKRLTVQQTHNFTNCKLPFHTPYCVNSRPIIFYEVWKSEKQLCNQISETRASVIFKRVMFKTARLFVAERLQISKCRLLINVVNTCVWHAVNYTLNINSESTFKSSWTAINVVSLVV